MSKSNQPYRFRLSIETNEMNRKFTVRILWGAINQSGNWVHNRFLNKPKEAQFKANFEQGYIDASGKSITQTQTYHPDKKKAD